MAYTKEIAVALFQQVGHDLHMQMRGPAAVFRPVAQMGDHIARRHPGARGAEPGQAAAQMAIERPEGARRAVMFQDQRMAVIQRIGIIVTKATRPGRGA